jgi:hypothetical protein
VTGWIRHNVDESPPQCWSFHLAIVESPKHASAGKIDDTATSRSISYYNANQVSYQPVSSWQGLCGAGTVGKYLISGTSNNNGLLFVGSIKGVGKSYFLNYPREVERSRRACLHECQLRGSLSQPAEH